MAPRVHDFEQQHHGTWLVPTPICGKVTLYFCSERICSRPVSEEFLSSDYEVFFPFQTWPPSNDRRNSAIFFLRLRGAVCVQPMRTLTFLALRGALYATSY